ncbi:1-acyl-sn-glycerol-3-phosphate acyltransferase [Streptomyces massasporeus]
MNGTTALSPWLPTAPCTPGHCAAHPGSAPRRSGAEADPAGFVRAVARLIAGLGTVLLGLLLAPPAGLLPAAARLTLVRYWMRAVVRAFGVHARYEGTPAPAGGPLLVVANHVSWLDIPLIAAVLPGRTVAKSEVRRWPVLGTLAALGGTLFIDREGIMALPGTVRTMAGSATIVRAARVAARLEEAVLMDPPAARRRLELIPGIGPWTSAETIQRSNGAPDEVTTGDLHLPGIVGWALAGDRTADDEAMLDLLAPYEGQRHRAARLILLSGLVPPRRAPRMTPGNITGL